MTPATQLIRKQKMNSVIATKQQPRPSLIVALGFLLTSLLAFGWQLAPAQAHDTLIGSNPTDGAQVVQTELPQITLQYSAELLQLGNAAVVTDALGKEIFNGEINPAGDTVVIELQEVPAPGPLQVNWRVVSSDGHPIEGTLNLQVIEDPNYQLEAAQEAAKVKTEQAAAAVSDGGGLDEDEVTAINSTEAEAAESKNTEIAGRESFSPWLVLILGLSALLVAAGVYGIAKRPSNK